MCLVSVTSIGFEISAKWIRSWCVKTCLSLRRRQTRNSDCFETGSWTVTCRKPRHQLTLGGVAVAHVLGAAVDDLVEGWRGGALKMDVIRPLQAAALKQDLVAADFDRGEAARAVARRGLEAFRTLPEAGQLSIWPRRRDCDISSTCTVSLMLASLWSAKAWPLLVGKNK